MSVPVRNSAAANYACVDESLSGLSNTLKQEEQYHFHQHQQQQQHQHQHQHQQYKSNNNSNSSSLTNSNFNNHKKLKTIKKSELKQLNKRQKRQQQQLMQQRSSMSSSVSPATPLVVAAMDAATTTTTTNNVTATNNINATDNIITSSTTAAAITTNINTINANNNPDNINTVTNNTIDMDQEEETISSSSTPIPISSTTLSSSSSSFADQNNDYDDDDMKPTTSAMAAAAATINDDNAAAKLVVVNAAETVETISGSDEQTEVQTEWMSDEGRYGTPGAAGLEYQKYELEQQQEQLNNPNTTNNIDDQPMMDPSLMDNDMENETIMSNDNENNNQNNDNNNISDNTNDANTNNANANNNNPIVDDEPGHLSTEEINNLLKEYDQMQHKYHTVLSLPKESKREVTAGGRDGSAYILRCLKMWYELPSDVLFNAMSLVDRFLDRMAVKPKHMACMSVASFYLAIRQLDLKPIPAEDLVTISQCGCTARDLVRMANVVESKLGFQMAHTPVTSISYLRAYFGLFRNVAKNIGNPFFEFYKKTIRLEDLENRLEVLLCDVNTTQSPPAVLALVLICLHLDFHIKDSYTRGVPELKVVFDYILYLQKYMKIKDRVFTTGFQIVSGILSHYNGQNKQPYKQRLVWRLSTRTLRVLRPTNRLSSFLPTILEGNSNAMDDGCRSRTESISSEEEEDWPTSPIIPIFEQC